MSRGNESGVGLVEVLISIAISTLVISALASILIATMRNSGTGMRQQNATHQLRNGLYWLNQDTQSAVASQATVASDQVTLRWTERATGAQYESYVQQAGDQLVRTLTIDGNATSQVIARDVAPGGFAVAQDGAALTYTLGVVNGNTTETRTETAMMRVSDIPLTPFETATPAPTRTPTPVPTDTPNPSVTPTPTRTATPTNTATPVPTVTNTPAACTASDTGLLSPTNEFADRGGDDDGFELNPTAAYGNGGGFATNDGGNGDRHRYYGYGIAIPAGCTTIAGIEVRLDYWLKNNGGNNRIRVQLSWNGGNNWTTRKTDTSEPQSETAVTFGGSNDRWGRTWNVGQLSNANFRVRIVMNLGNGGQEVYLDWAALRIYYAP